MKTISDEFMKEMLAKIKTYTLVILKKGPGIQMPGVDKLIWEHARRNFALREEGSIAIVCPISDGSEVAGVAIFAETEHKVKDIMDEDPGVKEGVFTYEVHPCRSFPGDTLP